MTKEEVFALPLNEDQKKVVNNTYIAAKRFNRSVAFDNMSNENDVIDFINSKLEKKNKKFKGVDINPELQQLIDVINSAVDAGISYSVIKTKIEKLVKTKVNAKINKDIKEYQRKIDELKAMQIK